MIIELSLYANKLLGGRISPLAKRLGSLQQNLQRSGLVIPVEAYLSFMVVVIAIVSITMIVNAFLIFLTVTKSLAYSAIMGVGAGLIGTSLVAVILYLYPTFVSSKKRRTIEEALPYALSFMSVLSTAGVPPRRIFASLATLEQEGKVGLGGEAVTMFREMELLGDDMLTVLRAVADRKSSPLLTAAFEGMISTIRSGGDFTKFLQEEARSLMRLRRSIIKEFLDSLVMISEMYISLMVAFPLILIVMLVIMSSIAGGGVGGLNPDMLVPIIIYGMVPGAGVTLMLMLDSISKK